MQKTRQESRMANFVKILPWGWFRHKNTFLPRNFHSKPPSNTYSWFICTKTESYFKPDKKANWKKFKTYLILFLPFSLPSEKTFTFFGKSHSPFSRQITLISSNFSDSFKA